MKFSSQQLEIINSTSEKILVKAGAGTGKTAVIIGRILRLLETDLNLSMKKIAIITFTNKATEELQARLMSELYKKWALEKNEEKKARYRVHLESMNSSQISTIHKFCDSILKEAGPFLDKKITYSPNFKIGSSRMYETIGKAIEEWIYSKKTKNEEIYHLDIMEAFRLNQYLRRFYTETRSKGLNIDEIISNTKMSGLFSENLQESRLKREIAEVIEYVQNFHKKYMYDSLDADDLLIYTSHVLKTRKDIKEKIQEKFKHIIVDEFQDTSLHQTEILKTLCDNSRRSPNLFVVGDSKQSIYAFRGADLDSYKKVKDWIKSNGEIKELKTNWRSSPEIVTFTNKVFQGIRNRTGLPYIHEPLKPKEKMRGRYTDAYTWLYGNNIEQSQKIADLLKEVKDNGGKLSDYAILVRYNHQINFLERELIKQNVDYTILGTGNLFKQIEILDLYKILLATLNSSNTLYTEEACNTLYFNGNFNALRELIINVNKNMLLHKLKPSQFLHFLTLNALDRQELSDKQISNLNKLKELSRKTFYNEHITLLDYAQWIKRNIISEDDTNQISTSEQEEDSVVLMTIHRSKGLEYPYVILPFLNNGVSQKNLEPPLIIDPETKVVEYRYEIDGSLYETQKYHELINDIHSEVYSEELRVLYVALTRAEKKIYLLGDQNKTDDICFQRWLSVI